MFLKNPFKSSFFRSIQFKIGLFFSFSFVILFVLLSAWLLLNTYNALIQDEMQFLYNRILTFYAQYEMEGADQLYNRAKQENETLPYMDYFLRLNNPDGEEVFFYMPPGWEEFDYSPLYETVASGDHRNRLNLSNRDESRNLVTVIFPLSDGSTLQGGVIATSQVKLITSLRKIMTQLFILLLVFAFITGVFVTARSLQPMARLNSEVEEITNTGELSHRLTLRKTGDQVDVMAQRINSMLDRIEDLVDGLKGTLDNTAHDLRTPLTRLMGRVELAMGGTEEEKDDALETALEESRHILTMLNTLMDISAAEKGLIKLREEPIRLKDLIDHVHDLYQIIAEEKEIDFVCSCRDDIVINGDPTRLNQVMANLIDNALKFTPRGGTVTLELESYDREGKTGAVIRVTDTGDGIPDEEKKHVWERLYRGEKSRTSPGLGLGLSMVKAVVEAFNGRIELDDNPRGGARFSLYLTT